MKASEAIEICEGWFAYLERQKEKARKMAELASLARTGPDGAAEAQKRMRQMDMCSVTVYDGGRLEPAVRALIKLVRASGNREG